ncbi:Methylmalonyl-CoA epimerase [Agrobacterium fabacearum CFBP 5771]|jgi:methylmalonyl-CoA/ethylmalonyl-CoA epimerase|uniref:methylmalonyl-CoA epimerase n=1 Tax=Agrobacterium tumefaciens TaxID=358 RepID=UPI0009B94A16|nr:methylmalonyl-CoA epimerase [Agrobacterium tumefaciens]CVI24817.1 Methylmalonyl-CoA epimerase [Agrobacterium fabacearum CFBP 5771]
MIRRVNHIAIAVPDLEAASATYRRLGVTVSESQELPEHGVRVSFLEFDNLKLELVEALGDASPIQRFIEKNPAGGIHHVCFEVEGLGPVTTVLRESGIRVLGSGVPKIGADGNPVIFAHPSDLFGVLTEFEEVPATSSFC